MARPRKVKRGDRVRADEWNALVEAVANRLQSMGGPLGGLGSVLGVPQSIPPPHIRLVQATHRASKSGDPDDNLGNEGQVWSQECRFVKIERGSQGYEPDFEEDAIFVYFPTQYRKLEGGGEQGTVDYVPTWHQTSHEGVLAGARFWAIYNSGSSRWEYLGPPNQVVRFKLLEILLSGNSALARVMWSQAGTDAPSEGEVIRVYDWQAGDSAAAGDLGYAIWFPDLGRWETVFRISSTGWLEKPCEVYGVHNSPITTDAETLLHFSNSRSWDTTSHQHGTDLGGAGPAIQFIELKKQGLYRIGFNISWGSATTTASDGDGTSSDIRLINNATARMIYRDGAGAATDVINGGVNLPLVHNKETGVLLGGTSTALTWLQTTSEDYKIEVRVTNASDGTAHPFAFDCNLWAVWLDHDAAVTDYTANP